jgi:glucose-6-phosphate isomerase
MDISEIKMNLALYSDYFDKTFKELKSKRIVERIWEKDYTVWSNDPAEITNRLGWLFSPEATRKSLDEINEFAEEIKKEGFAKILLLGMGGSSLAPEVFSLTFGSKKGHPELFVLDSTDPDAVYEFDKNLSGEKTLFIVSTKSGGTVETFSFMKYFYNRTLSRIGKEETGKRFIAITDPGSGLEKTAKELNFRKIFLNDPDIGGRYSALSLFGIVPAALIGVDTDELLKRASACSALSKGSDSAAGKLGSAIGELANRGRDKLTFIISPAITYFGAWIEQLIAESTGKNGKGILPVDGESLLPPEFYSDDRVFVHIHLKDDNNDSEKIKMLSEAGHPVIEIILNDVYDLGEQFFLWEMATSVAGWRLGIQPFDQPNVESAKVLARHIVKEFNEKGKLPEINPAITDKNISVYGDINGNSIEQALINFLGTVNLIQKPGNYISLQAYLKPDNETTSALQELRTSIQKKYKAAVTTGYGPRFLHSTGQLHKGDAGNGIFIQFISSSQNDLPIPDNPGEDNSSISFGVLKKAQALGDGQALLDNNRKVLLFNFTGDVITGIKRLTKAL